jgi:DNA-binding SARP family transcriptional activator
MAGDFEFFHSGQVLIKFDGAPIENLASIKAKALLIYLAVTGKSHSRSALAALLWSDMPDTGARANLRVALSALRKSIGAN